MKKIYFGIILFVISLIPILKVDATEGVNLTYGLKDEDGNALPDLILHEDFYLNTPTTTAYTYFTYSEDRNYEFVVFENHHNYDYVVVLIADETKQDVTSGSDKFWYDFKIDDSIDKPYVYYYDASAENQYKAIFSALTLKLQRRYNSRTAEYGYYTQSTYNKPFLIFGYNSETKTWTREHGYQYNIYTNKIIYSTFDIYINSTYSATESNLTLLMEGQKFNTSQLPEYLNGYKEVILTTEDRYEMISSIKKGSIYIPYDAFKQYGGRLSYFDKDLQSQPYTSIIQEGYIMEDLKFVRQDFDIESYEGADYMLFNKYLYLEGKDNLTYSIWVPDESYSSEVEIKPNASGGNDFTYNYIDENGEEQTTSFSSTGNANLNTIIDYVFSNSDNSILNYFSTIWEKIKDSSLYNYLLLIIMGSFIIYFIKAMNR